MFAGSCYFSFYKVKPFSFIRSIYVRSSSFRQIMNTYGSNESPCKIPAGNFKEVNITIGKEKYFFRVFIKHQYNGDSVFGETICL